MSTAEPGPPFDPSRRLLGGPAPWATLPAARRRPIPLASVLAALDTAGQLGPMPAPGAGTHGPLDGWRSVLPERDLPVTGASAVLVALFEERGEARVILTRRSAA